MRGIRIYWQLFLDYITFGLLRKWRIQDQDNFIEELTLKLKIENVKEEILKGSKYITIPVCDDEDYTIFISNLLIDKRFLYLLHVVRDKLLSDAKKHIENDNKLNSLARIEGIECIFTEMEGIRENYLMTQADDLEGKK